MVNKVLFEDISFIDEYNIPQVMYLMAFSLVLMFAKILKTLLFGTLRSVEYEVSSLFCPFCVTYFELMFCNKKDTFFMQIFMFFAENLFATNLFVY